MTLSEFFATLWRAKYEVLGAMIVVVGGTALFLNWQDASYEVTAEVRLATADAAIEGAEVGEVAIPVEESQVQSDEVVEAAAELLGVPAADLAARVSATVEEDANVQITVTGTDVEETAIATQAFAVAYATWLEEYRVEQIDYYGERRTELSNDLESLGPIPTSEDDEPEDPLAEAERELITSEYTTITVALRTLQAVPEPAAEPVAGLHVEEPGFGWEAVMGVAVLAGLAAGIGLAFARSGLDTRVRTSDRATRLTGAPVLAEVRKVSSSVRDFRRTEVLPVTKRNATPFTESIRELRTAIEVAIADEQNPVVVVTAADKYEPRPFITANLVASFGLSGLRVIVITGDLRRPRLTELLPAQDPDSTDEFVAVDGVPQTWLQRLPESSLDPADLLATARIRDLVQRARQRADIVIIDAPPVLAAADATILGRYATTSVLVAAAPTTNTTVLTNAVERLRTSEVQFAGIALAEVSVGWSMSHASTYGDDSTTTDPNRTVEPQEPGDENRAADEELDEASEPKRTPPDPRPDESYERGGGGLNGRRVRNREADTGGQPIPSHG